MQITEHKFSALSFLAHRQKKKTTLIALFSLWESMVEQKRANLSEMANLFPGSFASEKLIAGS